MDERKEFSRINKRSHRIEQMKRLQTYFKYDTASERIKQSLTNLNQVNILQGCSSRCDSQRIRRMHAIIAKNLFII